MNSPHQDVYYFTTYVMLSVLDKLVSQRGDMVTNEFTLMLLNKGWSVKDACEHWNIDYKTWQRMRHRDKDRNKLICMVNGLENKRFKSRFAALNIDKSL